MALVETGAGFFLAVLSDVAKGLYEKFQDPLIKAITDTNKHFRNEVKIERSELLTTFQKSERLKEAYSQYFAEGKEIQVALAVREFVEINPKHASVDESVLEDVFRHLLANFEAYALSDHRTLGLVLRAYQERSHRLLQEISSYLRGKGVRTDAYRIREMPPDTKDMLGRDKDIAKLRGRLKSHKVLGIIGLAGIGKSTVAAKLAEELKGEYKICWKDMSRSYEFNAFVAELLSQIAGVSAESISEYTPEQRIGALIGVVDEKPSFLVLDNFEHCLENRTISDQYLSRLLNECCRKEHGSKIIITSRVNPDALHVGYTKYDLGGIEKGSGVELLKRRGLKAEKKTLEFAEEKVDRHPYALQLLASLVVSYRADLKKCLEEEKIWPAEMEEVFLKEHFGRMSDPERGILEGMSVYREPVPEEAIAVFDGDNVYELLRSLGNKSLVLSADKLYFLHPIVKDYAYNNLKDKPTAHHNAAEWYEETYGDCPPEETNTPELLKPYEEIIFHYFESGTKDDILKGARITNYVGKFLQRFGLHDKKLHMLQRSREALEGAALQKTRDYAAHLNNIGRIHDARGEYDEALCYYEQDLKITRELGDRAGEAVTLNNIAGIHYARGEYDEALRYFNDSMKIKKEVGDRAGEAATLNNIGEIHRARGEYDEALRHYNDSLTILRDIGDRAGEARSKGNIGKVCFSRGEYDKASEYFEDCLKIFREVRDRAGEGVTLNNIGMIHKARGEYDEALPYYNDSLKIKKEIGDHAGEARTLQNIGAVHFEQEQYERAAEYIVPAFRIAREIGIVEENTIRESVDVLSEKLGRDLLQEDSKE